MKTTRFPEFVRVALLVVTWWLSQPATLFAADINPVLVGRWQGGEAIEVAVSGNYAFVAASDGGLQVVDVSDPAHPRWVAERTFVGAAVGVAVVSNFAYVSSWRYEGGGLQIFDISTPTNPRRIGSFGTSEGGSFYGGSLVEVSGNYGFFNASQGMEVIDLSNPANPQRVGVYDAGGIIRHKAVSGRCAYLVVLRKNDTQYIFELQVVDVSTPSSPQRVGVFNNGEGIDDVAVWGNHAFITGNWFDGGEPRQGLLVMDISNPTNPHQVAGFVTSLRFGNRVSLVGSLAYISSGTVIDISIPTTPKPAWSFGVVTQSKLTVSGKYAYAAGVVSDTGGLVGNLAIFDVSTPATPQLVGEYAPSGYATSVAPSGNYAYLAASEAGLQVVDISDSANPHRVGRYDTRGKARGVAVSGNFAYVADGEAGLQVIDISNPANPQRTGGYDTSGDAFGVVVAGLYAYVADRPAQVGTNVVGGGLQVFDVSTPANPQRAGGYDAGGYASQVAVEGNYAYVASTRVETDSGEILGGDLHVIEISNPANPQGVGGFSTTGPAEGLAVSSHYVYLASSYAGLQVIDVSNPANPQRIGGYDPDGDEFASRGWSEYVEKVTVSGNYAYVSGVYRSLDAEIVGCAACSAKPLLEVIDISNPASPRRLGGGFLGGGLLDYVDPPPTSVIALVQGKILATWRGPALAIFELSPFFKTTSQSNGQLHLSWESGAGTRLQTTPSLTNPDWQEVPGSENANALSLPISAAAGFFRLLKP